MGLVGARPAEGKKGADQGIDGRIYFHEGDGTTQQIILSVKAGKLHAPYVRDLRGVVEREKAAIGVLLTLDEPTKAMRTEAASAGFYKSPWGQHPRLQIVTVGELLDGKRLDIPPVRQTSVTYKRAPKAHRKRLSSRVFLERKTTNQFSETGTLLRMARRKTTATGLRLELEGQVTLQRLGEALDAWTNLLQEVGRDVAGATGRDAVRFVITEAKGGSLTLGVRPQPERKRPSRRYAAHSQNHHCWYPFAGTKGEAAKIFQRYRAR